jgi:hypothetical protein
MKTLFDEYFGIISYKNRLFWLTNFIDYDCSCFLVGLCWTYFASSRSSSQACRKCFTTFDFASLTRFRPRCWNWSDKLADYHGTQFSHLSSCNYVWHTAFMSSHVSQSTFYYLGTIALYMAQPTFTMESHFTWRIGLTSNDEFTHIHFSSIDIHW